MLSLSVLTQSARGSLVALSGLLCVAWAATPQARADGVTPRLLVATPALEAGALAQTVILAAPRPGGGHVGIILNRPSRSSLSRLFPKQASCAQVRDPVFYGGPVARRSIVALVKSATDPGEGTMRISPGLYLVHREAAIDRVIETTPNEARYYLGYVVWQPGQLERERARGWWSMHDADLNSVFHPQTEVLWGDLLNRANSLRAWAPGFHRAIGQRVS